MVQEGGPSDKEKTAVKQSSARKSNIQSQKRRFENKAFRSRVKSALRAFRESLEQKNKTLIMTSFNEVSSLVDKAANKKIFKKNKASRIKARLSARVQAVA